MLRRNQGRGWKSFQNQSQNFPKSSRRPHLFVTGAIIVFQLHQTNNNNFTSGFVLVSLLVQFMFGKFFDSLLQQARRQFFYNKLLLSCQKGFFSFSAHEKKRKFPSHSKNFVCFSFERTLSKTNKCFNCYKTHVHYWPL